MIQHGNNSLLEFKSLNIRGIIRMRDRSEAVPVTDV
jgi:hypothetical protein